MTPNTSKPRRETPYRFFYKHAGYGYNPRVETAEQGRRRGARALAAAEAYATAAGWEYQWDYDPEPCIGCDCGSADCPCSSGAPHEILCVLLNDRDNGRTLAALGGICGATREYRRVVAAELAMEAMP